MTYLIFAVNKNTAPIAYSAREHSRSDSRQCVLRPGEALIGTVCRIVAGPSPHLFVLSDTTEFFIEGALALSLSIGTGEGTPIPTLLDSPQPDAEWEGKEPWFIPGHMTAPHSRVPLNQPLPFAEVKIINKWSSGEMTYEINEHLDDGWLLHGPLSVSTAGTGDAGVHFCQMMVRHRIAPPEHHEQGHVMTGEY